MHLATWEAEGGRSLKPRLGDQSRQYSKALFQKEKKRKEKRKRRSVQQRASYTTMWRSDLQSRVEASQGNAR
jgi:hypothetical protein